MAAGGECSIIGNITSFNSLVLIAFVLLAFTFSATSIAFKTRTKLRSRTSDWLIMWGIKVKPTWDYLRSWVEQPMSKFQYELLKEACQTCADEVCRSFSYSHLGFNSKQNQKMLCLEHASQEKLRGQEIRSSIVPSIFILQQTPPYFSSTRSELPERDCTSGGQVSSVVVIVINGSTASSLTSFSSALLLAPAAVTAPLEIIDDGC